MGNAQTIVTVTAGRAAPVYAAVVAVTTAFTESALRNSTVHDDHDSEGLFQQRISIYTAAVADDPVKATNAFLDRLHRGTRTGQTTAGRPTPKPCSSSAYPQRYQPNAALGQQLVGIFWPPLGRRASRRGHTDVPAAARRPPRRLGAAGRSAAAGSAPAPGRSSARPATTSPERPPSPPGWSSPAPPRADRGPLRAGAAGQAVRVGRRRPRRLRLLRADHGRLGRRRRRTAAPRRRPRPHGTPEPTDLSQAVGGDLVMIPGADGTAAAPGHVGMVVGYTSAPTAVTCG